MPGEGQVAGKIVTNISRGLRVELRAPRNSITPAQIDRLGESPEIKPHDRYDRITFWVRSPTQLDTKQFQQVWRLCRRIGVEEALQSA